MLGSLRCHAGIDNSRCLLAGRYEVAAGSGDVGVEPIIGLAAVDEDEYPC